MSTDFPFPNDAASRADDSDAAATQQDEVFADDDGVLYDEEVTPEYGVLGFTLRELLIVGAWLVMFVLSFFPLGWTPALWAQGVAWVLPVGVPTVAVFLIVLRRFSPDGIRRVGSLGIDQFASVAFAVAAVWWVQLLWEYLAVLLATGVDAIVWVPWVQLAVSAALVAFTVFAPLIPGLKEDFQGRLVTLAHRNANPVRPVIARPRPEPVAGSLAGHDDAQPDDAQPDDAQPAAFATDEIAREDHAARVPSTGHASGGGTGTEHLTSDEDYVPGYARRSRGQSQEIASDTGSIESLLETSMYSDHDDNDVADAHDVQAEPAAVSDAHDLDATNPRESAPATQPFWILAASEREVHDERGNAIFRIGPTAWVLVIEDRGGAYVVRHDDGRIGYLHDIADITKG